MVLRGDEDFRYLPIHARDVQWGVYLTGTGYEFIPAGAPYPLRTDHPKLYNFEWEKGRVLPEYQIVYVTEGGGLFESASAVLREVQPGDVILSFPGEWHRYKPSEETGWNGYWLGFNGEFPDQLVARGFFSPRMPLLSCGVDKLIVEEFLDLFQQTRGKWMVDANALGTSALRILAMVLTAARRHGGAEHPGAPATSAGRDDPVVAKAIQLIWSKAHGSLSVSEVVSALPVTRRSLERRFRDLLGHTIHDEITRCRMERARGLLEKTQLPIKHVAATAGFSSGEHMTKTFRALEGISPSEYRRLGGGAHPGG